VRRYSVVSIFPLWEHFFIRLVCDLFIRRFWDNRHQFFSVKKKVILKREINARGFFSLKVILANLCHLKLNSTLTIYTDTQHNPLLYGWRQCDASLSLPSPSLCLSLLSFADCESTISSEDLDKLSYNEGDLRPNGSYFNLKILLDRVFDMGTV